jgi:hypothetical protein
MLSLIFRVTRRACEKISQIFAQQHLVQNNFNTFAVEKRSQKCGLLMYLKNAQSKQTPKGQKLA